MNSSIKSNSNRIIKFSRDNISISKPNNGRIATKIRLLANNIAVIIMTMITKKIKNSNSNSKCTRWDWQSSTIRKRPILKYSDHLFYTAYALKSSRKD